MFNGKKVIALVPARGGSKGLVGKNLSRVGGKTLIELAVESARGCSLIDEIYLSTDDSEIERHGKDIGIEIHQRSTVNSQDTSTAAELVSEFLAFLENSQQITDAFLIYLQPTSPLRTSDHVNQAFELLVESESQLCVSLASDHQTPFKSVGVDEFGKIVALFDNQSLSQNRQILPKTYHPNGAIYIFPIQDFLMSGVFPIQGSVPLMMSTEDSVDIDTYDDLQKAQAIWERNHG